MTLISKAVDLQQTIPVVGIPYELYTTETAIDTSLKEITILKKVGIFTTEGLQCEKDMFLARIAEIDEKLASIAEATSKDNIFYTAKIV